MSRFGDEYEADYNNAGELWQANVRRALSGRKGQKALRDLREALLALPEKRLISGALCTVGAIERAHLDEEDSDYRDDLEIKVTKEGEGVCAIGAFLWHKKVKAGADPRQAFDELPIMLDTDWNDDQGIETAHAGKAAGMTFVLAWDLAYRNDELLHAATPEERYESFLAWIEGQLADTPVAA